MDELIRKQDVIDAIYEQLEQIGYENDPSVLSIMQAIRDLPSAEPGRKTGKWLKYDGVFDYDVKCSECECPNYYETDFCPDCGAYMRGNEND